MKPKLRVWVVFGPRLKLGDGRARLLDAIHAKGSLRQAAADFGMSYRNAWGYLQELERAAGFKFFERTAGGGPASGMRSTVAGEFQRAFEGKAFTSRSRSPGRSARTRAGAR